MLFKFLLYCLFLAVTGSSLLHELSLVVVHGLPTAEASLAVHRLWGRWTCQSLQHVGPVIVSRRPWGAGSIVEVHGLSCPERMLSVLLVSSPAALSKEEGNLIGEGKKGEESDEYPQFSSAKEFQ